MSVVTTLRPFRFPGRNAATHRPRIAHAGQPFIEDYDDLYNTLDTYQAGQRVTLKIVRDGKLVELPIELVLYK